MIGNIRERSYSDSQLTNPTVSQSSNSDSVSTLVQKKLLGEHCLECLDPLQAKKFGHWKGDQFVHPVHPECHKRQNPTCTSNGCHQRIVQKALPNDQCQECGGLLTNAKVTHSSSNEELVHSVHPECQKGDTCMFLSCSEKVVVIKVFSVHDDYELKNNDDEFRDNNDELDIISEKNTQLSEENTQLSQQIDKLKQKLKNTSLCCCSYKVWCVFSCCLAPLLGLSIALHVISGTNPVEEFREFFLRRYLEV